MPDPRPGSAAKATRCAVSSPKPSKLDELDGIKASIRRIVEPISKTLRDYDMTQKQLRRLEAVQGEIAANAEVQRGKAADLEKRLAQQTGVCHALEEKRQQLEERLTFADQHKVALRKVLADAHSLLLARAAQVREQERRNQELAAERDALKARVSDIEAILHAHESELKGVDQAHTLYIKRYAALDRACTGKECALVQAERSIALLSADLHREKWEREQVEEALRTARQESAVAMRNLAILQRNQASPYLPPTPPDANSNLPEGALRSRNHPACGRLIYRNADRLLFRESDLRHPGGGRLSCRTASTAICRRRSEAICPTMPRAFTASRSITLTPAMPGNPTASSARI